MPIIGPKYCTCSAAFTAVSPLTETIMVVASTKSLDNRQSIIGSIDINKDNSTTGYAIYIETDGRLTFRSQKMIPNKQDLRLSTISCMTWLRLQKKILKSKGWG